MIFKIYLHKTLIYLFFFLPTDTMYTLLENGKFKKRSRTKLESMHIDIK